MRGAGRGRLLDRTVYVTPDGVSLLLSAPEKWWVLTEEGFGMPPIEYVTQRGPFQHGETLKDFFLRPRVVQLTMRVNGCSRSEYWDLRNQILGVMRPGRDGTSPGVLRKYLANGAVRELECYIVDGPSFPGKSANKWDEWSIMDTLRFQALDPVLRNPALKTFAYVSTGGASGTFPLTFPLTIAAFSSPGGGLPINYLGNWLSYPTIILNGPLVGPLVRNLTTGEKIEFSGSIASGRVVTIDLTFGHKTVTLDDGTNQIGFISSDSDLGSFHLTPGNNQIQVNATGTSAISSVVLQWYDRFIGI